MREIKFRAWEIIGDNPQAKDLKGIMFCWDYMLDSNAIWLRNLLEGNERFVLMQYTGLLDKNGVEIYEGDILSMKTMKGIQPHTIEWVDHFSYTGFKMYGIDRRWNKPLTNSRLFGGGGLVIGNIYKDKNLLK